MPLAIAEALKSGNLGVLDYYNLNNIKADTDMRESFQIKKKIKVKMISLLNS